MRILQLIDSLETGGAERMAVNYANALAKCADFSGLAVTRNEGTLLEQLNSKVVYSFLGRNRTIDIKALFRLKKLVKTNRIDIIHAHTSSFLFAILLKFIHPKIKIIWHDHNGNRAKNKNWENKIIKWCSVFFNGIIVVNSELEIWAEENLKTKNIIYLPNFTSFDENETKKTFLKGIQGKRMVCLANLRDPKNHMTFLKAFLISNAIQEQWTLHLIGKDNNDDYSAEIKRYIKENGLEEIVFIHGSCSDIFHILNQASIGVLSSTYEGFPVTLLEYGLSELAVMSTNVGFCPEVIQHGERGFLFNPLDTNLITQTINMLISNEEEQRRVAKNLNIFVKETYSEASIMEKVKAFYNRC